MRRFDSGPRYQPPGTHLRERAGFNTGTRSPRPVLYRSGGFTRLWAADLHPRHALVARNGRAAHQYAAGREPGPSLLPATGDGAESGRSGRTGCAECETSPAVRDVVTSTRGHLPSGNASLRWGGCGGRGPSISSCLVSTPRFADWARPSRRFSSRALLASRLRAHNRETTP